MAGTLDGESSRPCDFCSATVVDPAVRAWRDVVLTGEPETVTQQVGSALSRVTRPGAPPATPHIDGQPVDPGLLLAELPLRDGAFASLDTPEGCPPRSR